MKLSATQRKMLTAVAAAHSMSVPYRLGADNTAKSLQRLGLIDLWIGTNNGRRMMITSAGRAALVESEQK